MWQRTDLGHGIGLRVAHYAHILENGVSDVDWFEIVSENGSSVYRVGAATFPLPEPTASALRALSPSRSVLPFSAQRANCSSDGRR